VGITVLCEEETEKEEGPEDTPQRVAYLCACKTVCRPFSIGVQVPIHQGG
jgi:hypothetical protein